MRTVRLGLLGMTLLPLAYCPAADAQTEARQAGTPSDKPAETRNDDEIVVTANRYYGEASVATETEFDESEIASQGVDNVQGLLDRLAPFIDPAGNAPVVLINGRPVDGDRSILSYPPEALNRVAVLKPDAAAQYGYPADRRVVNLVLKKHFSSMNLDAGGLGATRGGQYGGELSAGRVTIDGPTRWNVLARLSSDTALRKSARDIVPAPGIFDVTGYVAAPDGGEIDPALSLLAGHVTMRAGIPDWQAPTLADFAATADRSHPVDPNAYETLLPSRRALIFSAGVSRPIGALSASLNLNATSTASHALRGLPMASLVLPADNPWSSFADDVLLVRPLAGERTLRNDNSAQTLGVSFTLSGRISGWQVSLSSSYARSRTESLLERGIDTGQVQALLGAGDPSLNPYGPWSSRLLLTDRNRSRGDNLSARLNVIKTLADLPAGPLTANLTINAARSALESRVTGSLAGMLLTDRQSGRFEGQIALNVPVSRRTKDAIGPLGDLTIDLLAGGQAIGGNSLQKRYGAGFTWSPAPFAQLRGTLENVEGAPTPEQLDGPIVTTINRVFDYARQEAVDAVWILGGNPELRRGRRQSRALTTMFRPLSDQTLTLNLGYGEQVAKGGVAPFPELTPAIEAAFPERVVRDAAGRLVSVDARPINLVSETTAELSSGIALRLPRRSNGLPSPAAADPMRWTLSLNYRRRLKNELRTRPGLPAINQLDGGGQPRDFVSIQIAAGKREIGASLNGNWSGNARLAGSSGQDYRFAPFSTFNLSTFLEPEHALGASRIGWLKNLKLSLDLRNLFDSYRRVTLRDGSVPLGYRRDEIHPLGRTVRLTVRKRF